VIDFTTTKKKMTSNTKSSSLYLGVDVGTQSLKVCLIDNECIQVDQYSVDYDSKLPHYNTTHGVHQHENHRVTCPPLMWIEALDHCLQHLAQKKLLSRVKAISTSGQQHGSVYWTNGCLENVLKRELSSSENAGLSLYEICKKNEEKLFVCDSPIWMDSSTSEECRQLEQSVGGKKQMIYTTGSCATERFTGSHILRMYNQNKQNDFERVSLISSFIPTLFLGRYAQIDYSDASGMNLLDINACDKWSNDCVSAASNEHTEKLKEQLGPLASSLSTLGVISDYMKEQYGFPEDCLVVAGTGDNPSSACGTIRQQGDLVISLGTSHTVFGYTDSPALTDDQDPDTHEGHTFVSPLFQSNEDHSVEKYMKLICFKNGANVRNLLCESLFNSSWKELESFVSQQFEAERSNLSSIEQNNTHAGFYYLSPEITPHTGSHSGLYHVDTDGQLKQISQLQEKDALTLYESQCIALKLHAKRAGLLDSNTEHRRLIVTGGASESKTILFLLAQVFNCDVYGLNVKDSAAVGAACRALFAHTHSVPSPSSDYLQMLHKNLPQMECIARKVDNISHWYTSVLEPIYSNYEQQLLQSFHQ
jgi:xylulokinase